MKVFVVCAVLVASVAARSVELDSLRGVNSLLNRRDSLLKRDSLLRGDAYTPRVGLYDEETLQGLSTYNTYDIPSTSVYSGRQVSVLSYEEIIASPLFREYYAIPLFRQYFERYPVVFRRYIESPLFQQFWTVPAFQGYFRNPVLFYKYIVPQLQMIQEYPVYNGDYEYPRTTSYTTDRDVVLREYLARLFDREGRVPTSTFGRFVPETTTYGRYGQEYTNTGVYGRENYAYLLDKIYKTLFVNQPTVGDVTQVRTDVKVAPAQKEVIVEPVTGEKRVVVEEPRIVDVKVQEQVLPKEVVGQYPVAQRELIKETILKKLLVQKVITPEVYEILKTLSYRTVEEYIRQRQVEGVVIPRDILDELVRPEFNVVREGRQYDNVIRDLVNQQVHGQRYNQVYNNEIYGEQGVVSPVLRDLVNNVYGRQGQRQVVDELVRRV